MNDQLEVKFKFGSMEITVRAASTDGHVEETKGDEYQAGYEDGYAQRVSEEPCNGGRKYILKHPRWTVNQYFGEGAGINFSCVARDEAVKRTADECLRIADDWAAWAVTGERLVIEEVPS